MPTSYRRSMLPEECVKTIDGDLGETIKSLKAADLNNHYAIGALKTSVTVDVEMIRDAVTGTTDLLKAETDMRTQDTSYLIGRVTRLEQSVESLAGVVRDLTRIDSLPLFKKIWRELTGKWW